jgi:hypothetical protein
MRAKLQPGTSSSELKQYGDQPIDGPTNRRTDKVSYRGAMLGPKNGSQLEMMNQNLKINLKANQS